MRLSILILANRVIPTQFAGVNLGGLSDFRHVFSLTTEVVYRLLQLQGHGWE